MANHDLKTYIAERKQALAGKNRPAMVMTHVVCGYPSFEDNWKELEIMQEFEVDLVELQFPFCLLYTSPSPRDHSTSRMPSSA